MILKTLMYIFAGLLLCFGLGASLQAQPPPPTGTVNVALLNVRATPSTQSTILTQIRRGEVYPVLGKSPDLRWWQIQVDADTSGWVFGVYLEVIGAGDVPISEASPTPRPNPETVEAGTDVLPRPAPGGLWRLSAAAVVYGGPGIFTPIVGHLPASASVQVTARNETGQWVKVRAGEWGVGWVQAAVFGSAYDVAALPLATR